MTRNLQAHFIYHLIRAVSGFFLQLALAKVCINGNPLGLEGKACADQVAQFFSSSLHTPHRRATEVLKGGIKDTMR